jgi:adenosylhomocysteine nucleosidase
MVPKRDPEMNQHMRRKRLRNYQRNHHIDRIEHLHSRYGTSVEEMETASAAQIAGIFAIPFLGIRVLSDNITNQGAYDPTAGLDCQEFVYHVVY